MLADQGKPSLLLVEDDEDDAFFFHRTFRKSGAQFRIEHALNGAQAIERLQSALAANSLPRLIFLDLKMPVLNGFDVLTWMRKQSFPAPIPVVVLTGSEEQEDKTRALALGAIEYLVKPVGMGDFERLLAGVFFKEPIPAIHQTGTSP